MVMYWACWKHSWQTSEAEAGLKPGRDVGKRAGDVGREQIMQGLLGAVVEKW